MVMIYKVLDDLELSLSVRQVTVHCDPSTVSQTLSTSVIHVTTTR